MTAILNLIVRVLFRARVEGAALSGTEAPLLFAARHRRRLDSILLALLLPHRPRVVLPAEETRSWLFRALLACVPHAVLDVNNPRIVKPVLRMLAEGRSMLLYPEGRVVECSAVMKNYDVPALIAARSGVPVVAVAVDYGVGWWPRTVVRVGEPTRLVTAARAGKRATRALQTRTLRRLLECITVEARSRQSLFDAFLDALEQHGRRTPIIDDVDERARSYQQVLKGSLAVGRWAARSSDPGENVGVLLPNLVPAVYTLLGLIAFGRVPALLNYSAGSAALHDACTAARVRTVITSRAFIERANLAAQIAGIRTLRILYLEDLRRHLGLVDRLWLLFAVRFPRRVAARCDPLGPAVVMFTSGSETRPKGVVLSHDAVIANIRQIGAVIEFTARDKVLNALPLYHSYSFCAGLMLCLITGVKLSLYLTPLRYRAIPEIAYRRDATYLFGTSTFLSYYARHAHQMDFHSVRYVICGGEKLGEEVARVYLERFGLRVYEGYGSTECGPVIALSTPQSYRFGAVGHLMPGMEHRLEKVDGVEHGGVLHLRGPNLMLGYYRYDNPGVIEPRRSIFGDCWYNTGDVVDIGADGIVTVVGRVKRFAKIAGEMVSLDAIEEIALRASPAHRHAAVVRAEVASGETTVLFTTDPGLGRHALTAAAREMGRQDLAVARRVVFVPELPLLGSGKTDYVTLQALDLEEAAANDPAGGGLKVAEPPAPYR